MKNLRFYIIMMVFSLSFIPSTILASEKNTADVPVTTNEMPAEVKTMLNRLEEIKNMDKSNMSRSEKKELRAEVKTIKKNLKASNHGIYLSIGAVIIIILLLILLL